MNISSQGHGSPSKYIKMNFTAERGGDGMRSGKKTLIPNSSAVSKSQISCDLFIFVLSLIVLQST